MTSYASYLANDHFAIFLLHGVIRKQSHVVRNYTRKHIPLDDFVRFLQELKETGIAVSMDDVVAAQSQGERLPARAFAITFDDGFENNASIAAPVLDEFGMPAMFYVTTGFVGTKTRSWTDEIEAAIEHANAVDISGLAASIDGCYRTVPQKIALMNAVRTYVKGNDAIDPYEFAADLMARADLARGAFDPELDAKLEWNQIRSLAAHPLFTVGGHSHTHRILSFLSREDLDNEVATSMELLGKGTGKPVRHYSYPEGLSHCYSDEVISTLKRHGIICSPTAEDGVNSVGDSLFHLKRIFVV